MTNYEEEEWIGLGIGVLFVAILGLIFLLAIG